MCFPPFCQPAKHFLGCLGLRQGAAVVLILDALYGLSLVVLHGMLLGQVQEPVGPAHAPADVDVRRLGIGVQAWADQGGLGLLHLPAGTPATAADIPDRRLTGEVGRPDYEQGGLPGGGEVGDAGGGRGEDGAGGGRATQTTSWMLQLADLDFGWGHRLLDFSDHLNLMGGLLYGVAVMAACGLMLYSVVIFNADGLPDAEAQRSSSLSHAARWFVAFLNLQFLAYAFLVVMKLPRLCWLQSEYYPALDMECEVLRCMFLERAVCTGVIASLCIWVFSSFAYVLTFGEAAHVDQAHFKEQMEKMLNLDDVHAAEHRLGIDGYLQPLEQRLEARLERLPAAMERLGVDGYGQAAAPPPAGAAASRLPVAGALARHQLASDAPAAAHPAAAASSRHHTRHHHGHHSARGSAAGGGHPPPPSSLHGGGAGGAGAGGSSRLLAPMRPVAAPPRAGCGAGRGPMARAGSSMVTSASQAEMQPLIKPPVAVY